MNKKMTNLSHEPDIMQPSAEDARVHTFSVCPIKENIGSSGYLTSNTLIVLSALPLAIRPKKSVLNMTIVIAVFTKKD